jgi:hypothetical protein
VLGEPFCCAHVPVAKCQFSSHEGAFPGWVGCVATRGDWDKILNWASEDAFRWGDFGGGVRCISVLENCTL